MFDEQKLILAEHRPQEYKTPVTGFFDNRITCEWLSTKEAACYLGLTPNALRILVHRNRVKAFKLGSRLKFRTRDLRLALQEKGA